MGFKEVASLDAEVTVSIGKKDKKTGKPGPKEAEGYYLGTRKVETRLGETDLHFLQTPKGNLGVWGTTDMNKKLKQVALGSMVRITSTGTKATKNGDMYTYRVEVDNTNTIEVSAETTTDSGYAEESNGDDRGYNSDDQDTEDAPEYTAIVTGNGKSKGGGTGRAAAPATAVNSLDAAAARKARVDELLGKNKAK